MPVIPDPSPVRAPFRSPETVGGGPESLLTPWGRVAGHLNDLIAFGQSPIGPTRHGSAASANEAYLESWLRLPTWRVWAELLRSLIRRGPSLSAQSPRLFWLSHPAIPLTAQRILAGSFGRLLFPTADHQRLRLRVPRSARRGGRDTGPAARPERLDGAELFAQYHPDAGANDTLLGLTEAQVEAGMRALTQRPISGKEVAWMCRLARDPRAWSSAFWTDVEQVLVNARQQLDAPPRSGQNLQGQHLLSWLLDAQLLWAASTLLMRADLPVAVAEQSRLIIKRQEAHDQRESLIAALVATPDFLWAPRETPAAFILRLLVQDNAGELLSEDHLQRLGSWVADQATPGKCVTGLRATSDERDVLWSSLQATPTVLIQMALWLERRGGGIHAYVRRDCAEACRGIPPASWRPFLLSKDAGVRLNAVRLMGTHAEAAQDPAHSAEEEPNPRAAQDHEPSRLPSSSTGPLRRGRL